MTRRRVSRSAAGLTLVELLIGLAVTGIIGGAVAAMLAAVAQGVEGGGDVRRVAAQHKIVEARLGGTLRYARQPLACFDYTGSDGVAQRYLVLWMSDAVTGGSPNLSEIRVLQWDPRPSHCRVTSYRVSLAVGATDATYPLNSGFTFLARWIEGEATSPPKPAGVTLPGEVWLEDVSDFRFRFGHTNKTTYTDTEVQATNLVSYRVSVNFGGTESIVCGAAALRNAP